MGWGPGPGGVQVICSAWTRRLAGRLAACRFRGSSTVQERRWSSSPLSCPCWGGPAGSLLGPGPAPWPWGPPPPCCSRWFAGAERRYHRLRGPRRASPWTSLCSSWGVWPPRWPPPPRHRAGLGCPCQWTCHPPWPLSSPGCSDPRSTARPSGGSWSAPSSRLPAPGLGPRPGAGDGAGRGAGPCEMKPVIWRDCRWAGLLPTGLERLKGERPMERRYLEHNGRR